MGKRGPAPKPTNLRIFEGNPSNRPLNSNEPQPETGATCPTWLSDVATAEWERLAPVLLNCGILTKADQNTLAAYCEAFANYVRASEEIRDSSLTLEGKRIAPIINAQKVFADQLVKFGTKLGLSPSDRSSIKVSPQKQKESKWDALTK